MDLTLVTVALSLLSGSAVGFSLGLIGGGGSVLAVPLLAYVVGLAPAHAAIGTSALAVAANAAINLAGHARRGNVKWNCALVFAGAGVVGAFVGSSIGKIVDGDQLLALFSLAMFASGIAMLRKRDRPANADVRLTLESASHLLPRLIGIGLGAGMLSGFFGIGGGFLIVPGLILATGMPMLYAVGSSLVGVTAFGFTTAANYAVSGLIDWPIAGLFLLGGMIGGWIGIWSAGKLAADRQRLNLVFAVIVLTVGVYVAAKGFGLV